MQPMVEKAKVESVPGKRRLVVAVHGSSLRKHSLELVKQRIREAYPDADIWAPSLPMRRWSMHSPQELAKQIIDGLDALWQPPGAAAPAYDDIVLIGYSFGSLLVRKAYVCAWGENPDAPMEKPFSSCAARPWVSAVSRIVLLAGINRGWTISHNLSITEAVAWRIGVLVAWAMRFLTFQTYLIMQCRRGAPFITQLRIQSLSMMRRAVKERRVLATTVQLLGSVDDIVSPEDSVDLITGRNFFYLDVPYSGHMSILDMDGTAEGDLRAKVFLRALRAPEDDLRKDMVRPADVLPPEPEEDVTDVVFVIHGIRDEGFWTHKIARKVREAGRRAKRVYQTETSTYGYFPMLPFLLPPVRRAKVEWLMDQYTEDLSLYPNARFSFIGHSNGTYLLARALKDYPAVRFERVVFAGSVVRSRYEWDKMIARGQVGSVLNYVASGDWVVAFFPKALEMLRLQDLGGLGHDGFRPPAPANGNRVEVRYARGGHSAALNERHWDDIAEFVVNGTTPKPNPLITQQRTTLVEKLIAMVGRFAPLVWVVIIALAGYGGWWIWHAVDREWLKVVAVGLYGFVIWRVLTRL